MKLGLFSIGMAPCTDAATIRDAARECEEAGFDSLWSGEHVVLGDPQVAPSPLPPDAPTLDPVVALAWAAAATTTIRLASGLLILPQRNPVILAKQLASLDVLSGGRFTLGVGVGNLEVEYRTLGIDFADRGGAADEYLDVLARLWYDERPAHHGARFDFEGIDARPRPLQQPIPIVVGGKSTPAYRRTVARANGWYGFRLDPDALTACLRGLQEAADTVERPDVLGTLEITVTPPGRLTPELAERYAELGVGRIVTVPPIRPDGVRKAIDATLAATASL